MKLRTTKWILLSIFLLGNLSLWGQSTSGLVTYYPFDNSLLDQSGNASNGFISGDSSMIYACGLGGSALRMNGSNNKVIILGVAEDYFETDDFTIAFFFSPNNLGAGTQTLVTKGENCDDIQNFAIRYSANSRTVTAELNENSSKKSVVDAVLDDNKCWQHVAVVRSSGTTRLYINGVLRSSNSAISRIDLTNNGVLQLGSGACVGVIDFLYSGLMDEFRLYERALSGDEVLELYTPFEPNVILTRDTTVFLGDQVQIIASEVCVDDLIWTPDDELIDANNNVFMPTVSGSYSLDFIESNTSCISTDSVRITVIDPNNLDCTKIFLPNAFTPNDDGKNDTYGISNPYAVIDLVSFEIFDRWGGKVFATDDPFEQWNGSFKGKEVNPGVFLYKALYKCKGEELSAVGSLSVIR